VYEFLSVHKTINNYTNDTLILDSWFCKQNYESANTISSDWWNLIYDEKFAHASLSIFRPYWCVVFVRTVFWIKKGIFNCNIYSPNICFVPYVYIRITRYIYINIMSLLVTTRQGSSLKLCGIATSAWFSVWPRPNDKLSFIWLVFVFVYKILRFQTHLIHALVLEFCMIFFLKPCTVICMIHRKSSIVTCIIFLRLLLFWWAYVYTMLD
jgi:hypothetical protein